MYFTYHIKHCNGTTCDKLLSLYSILQNILIPSYKLSHLIYHILKQYLNPYIIFVILAQIFNARQSNEKQNYQNVVQCVQLFSAKTIH